MVMMGVEDQVIHVVAHRVVRVFIKDFVDLLMRRVLNLSSTHSLKRPLECRTGLRRPNKRSSTIGLPMMAFLIGCYLPLRSRQLTINLPIPDRTLHRINDCAML